MEWVACVGIDWGEEEHAYTIRTANGESRAGKFKGSSEEIHEWVRQLREWYPTGSILIGIEQGRGSLMYALMAYDFLVLIPVNPRASKSYRDSLHLSGSSNDAADAETICNFVMKHGDVLRSWRPEDTATRKLRALVETRRLLVDQRTTLTHQLSAALKMYFPQLLQWFGGEGSALLRNVVRLWPTLEELRDVTLEDIVRLMRAHRMRGIERRTTALLKNIDSAVALTHDVAIVESSSMYAQTLAALIDGVEVEIEKYENAIDQAWATHPDRAIFQSVPGAGRAFAPRLAVAFGTDRNRYRSPVDLQCFAGIAPVTEQSGKQKLVRARLGYPTFLHQTFHEFAAASLPHVPWAKALYQTQRERGASHHKAVRAVAFRWIRVLFRLWKDRREYDDVTYVDALKRKGSPLPARFAA